MSAHVGEDSAGSIMTTEMIELKENMTVDKAFQIIKDTLRYNRNKEDKLVEKMYDDASGILFEIFSVYQKDKKDLEESLVKKLKNSILMKTI